MAYESPTGKLIWRGDSKLTGEPVALFAVPPESGNNSKTGKMIQTFVLPDKLLRMMGDRYWNEGLSAEDAAKWFLYMLLKEGRDADVCLDCLYRSEAAGGIGACYCHGTPLYNGVRQMLVSWMNKGFQEMHPTQFVYYATQQFRKYYTVRLGSYSEIVHIPWYIINQLLNYDGSYGNFEGHTGYTHQWRHPNIDPLWKHHLMASCNNLEEMYQAKALGWRTFTVTPGGLDKLDRVEHGLFKCPSPAVKCEDCLLCSGKLHCRATRDPYIVAHGTYKNRIIKELRVTA